MLGLEASAALGMTLDSLVDRESLHDIRNRMAGLSATGGTEQMYGITLVAGRSPFDIAIHYVNDLCVLEGEPAGLDSRMGFGASTDRSRRIRVLPKGVLNDQADCS